MHPADDRLGVRRRSGPAVTRSVFMRLPTASALQYGGRPPRKQGFGEPEEPE